MDAGDRKGNLGLFGNPDGVNKERKEDRIECWEARLFPITIESPLQSVLPDSWADH